MNTYITLACLLAVAASAQASAWGGYGWGGLGGYGHVYSAPILAPAAVSTANVYKAAPIPIIRTVVAPVISAPIIKTVPVASYSLGGLGYGGWGGWGGYGLGYGGHGLGLGGLGYGLGKH